MLTCHVTFTDFEDTATDLTFWGGLVGAVNERTELVQNFFCLKIDIYLTKIEWKKEISPEEKSEWRKEKSKQLIEELMKTVNYCPSKAMFFFNQ